MDQRMKRSLRGHADTRTGQSYRDAELELMLLHDKKKARCIIHSARQQRFLGCEAVFTAGRVPSIHGVAHPQSAHPL